MSTFFFKEFNSHLTLKTQSVLHTHTHKHTHTPAFLVSVQIYKLQRYSSYPFLGIFLRKAYEDSLHWAETEEDTRGKDEDPSKVPIPKEEGLLIRHVPFSHHPHPDPGQTV
ncbi:unnamed protein product [Rangifer tarandus platyrhynchus]|uniref:Uncharacterized protein n=1 Tax=Rangifer tarandus platyrhynchus TaxID=3082113 RepID=A0AC59ZZN6_RANTA